MLECVCVCVMCAGMCRVGTYSNLKDIIKGMNEWSYEDMEGCEPKAINESLSHVIIIGRLQDVLGCLVITTFSCNHHHHQVSIS